MSLEDYSTQLSSTETLEWWQEEFREPDRMVEVSPTQELNQLIVGHESLMGDDVEILQTMKQMDTSTLSHLLALALEWKKHRCLNYLLTFTDHLSWGLLAEFELYSRYKYHNHGRGTDKYKQEFYLLQRLELPSTLVELVTLLLYPVPHPVRALEGSAFEVIPLSYPSAQ